ncbi:Uncharacterised protein [uncultured archaeon]|nr:Uncharacterised protein [uncultured archaeon]
MRDFERFFSEVLNVAINGGEEDLLAFYLHNGRDFLSYDQITITDNLWEEFIKRREYQAKKEADKESYVWDRLIEVFCNDYLNGNLEFGNSLNEVEKVMRTMARENRFERRLLGKYFIDFMELASQKKVRARIFPSPSGVAYVLLACPHDEDRKERLGELGLRCFVTRGLFSECTTVIGIATEQYEKGKGFSLDTIYLSKITWTIEDQTKLDNIQKDLGYFSNPIKSQMHEDEYPTS